MSDSVECPHCGTKISDLWDYNWTHAETVEVECGECNKPLTIERHVSVTYRVLEEKDNNG